MNKFLLVPLLFSVGILISCAQKRDRITTDTLYLTIEPSQAIVAPSTKTTLQVVSHNASGVSNADISPTWNIAAPNLGSFTPPQGKTVTFNSSTLLGMTTIYCQYGSAQAIGNVTVTNVVPSSATSIELDVFREISMSQNAAQAGCSLFEWSWPNNITVLTQTSGILGDDHTEGAHGLRVDILNEYGGAWWQFGTVNGSPTPIDKSACSNCNLVFDVKIVSLIAVDMQFEVHYIDKTHYARDLLSNHLSNFCDGNWHTVSVPIKSMTNGSSIDFSKITYPFEIHSAPQGGAAYTNFTLYIDNIRWEQ